VVFGGISVERYLFSDLLLQATPAIPLQYHSAERRNGYHGLATFDKDICLAWCIRLLLSTGVVFIQTSDKLQEGVCNQRDRRPGSNMY